MRRGSRDINGAPVAAEAASGDLRGSEDRSHEPLFGTCANRCPGEPKSAHGYFIELERRSHQLMELTPVQGTRAALEQPDRSRGPGLRDHAHAGELRGLRLDRRPMHSLPTETALARQQVPITHQGHPARPADMGDVCPPGGQRIRVGVELQDSAADLSPRCVLGDRIEEPHVGDEPPRVSRRLVGLSYAARRCMSICW